MRFYEDSFDEHPETLFSEYHLMQVKSFKRIFHYLKSFSLYFLKVLWIFKGVFNSL